MDRFNSFDELPGVGDVFVDNMAPTALVFKNLQFSVGGEGKNKPAHVHVKSPDGGEAKIWLEPEIKVARHGIKGSFTDKDLKNSMEQIEANYEKLKADYYRQFEGEHVQREMGKKAF